MSTAGDVLSDARDTLVDPLVPATGDGVTWTQAELLRYLTLGLFTLCNVKNDAYKVVRDIPLVAGYVQRLPQVELTGDIPVGLALFEVLANTNGDAVNQVGREVLNAADPAWVRATPTSDIIEWMTDVRDRTTFFVNPPNDGTGLVKVMYGALPPVMVDVSQTIPVSDAYRFALANFVVGQAYAANTKRKDTTKSQMYMQMFNQQIGLRTASQVQAAPKLSQEEPQ